MKSDRMRALKSTTARVAPLGRPKAFAKTIPITANTTEKTVLTIKVCLIFLENFRAKNPGTRSKVSTKIVPASLMLVTIRKANKTKKV